MPEKKFGRYIYRRKLGEGGMGIVIQAYDPQTRRDVAIKILPPQALAQPESLERFRREAEAIAQLEHPAIVPLYDYGIENGRPYLVMRLMKGGSLADRIKPTPMPPQKAINILKQIASGIDFAHSKRIIHRDIKPTNILFDEDGNAHLADFGIMAYMSGATQTDLTKTSGSGLGTPDYMSPEQAKATTKLDGRTDIYSFGVVVFEMLAGRVPYQSDTPLGVAVAHMMEPVPRLAHFNNQLPADCDIVIQRTMAKKREDRYQTAGAAVADLEAALQGKPLAMTALMPSPPNRRTQTTRAAPPPPKKKTSWLGIFSVILLMAICVIGAGLLWTQRDSLDILANTIETPIPAQEVATVGVVDGNLTDTQVEENTLLPTNTPEPATTDAPLPTNTPIPTSTPQPSATPLPTFTPTPISIPQFYDSFDAGISAEWDYNPDDWGTVNGQLVNLRRNIRNIWIGDETWQNYSVEMDLFGDMYCHLYILYTEDDHYLYLNLSTSGISWHKDGNQIPNTYISLNSEQIERPYKVQVTTQNNIITTYVNGAQLNQLTMSGYEAGKIGIFCGYNNYGGGIIDNFIVTPLN